MATMIEARSFRPFKSSEEYLYAMKEDLAEWLNTLYPELMINVDNFLDRLDTGVALCKHANNVRASALEQSSRRAARGLAAKGPSPPPVQYLPAARPLTFFARDNVSNFISWCRKAIGIFECLLFETDDLILRKNEKHVILCLLEVARKGFKFGMLAPMLIQMEQQIDKEILADARRANGQGGGGFEEEEDEEDEGVGGGTPAPPMVYGPMPQIVTNDLKSLDEMVRDLVERCNCPTQFPMIRVSEGKYRIGDTKVLIFVRVLRSHVMVRVGGGWDTLSHYLDKHDPCRCRAQHRPTLGARVIQRYPPATNGQCMDLTGAEVHYDRSPPRTRRSSVSSVGSSGGGSPQHTGHLGPPQHTAARQRSRSPAGPASLPYMGHTNNAFENHAFNHLTADNAYHQAKFSNRRSVSPSPARKNNRTQSPNPQRKATHQFAQISQTIYNNPALVSASSLLPTPHRNNRSRSPTPKVPNFPSVNLTAGLETQRQITTPEKEIIGTSKLFDTQVFTNTAEHTALDNVANGSENGSDHGSEVSDEGYRSLGIIQNGSTQTTPPGPNTTPKDTTDRGLGLKLNRLSLNSQASTEDADINERPELTVTDPIFRRQASSSDCSSQMSTTEDRSKDGDGSPNATNSEEKLFLDRSRKSPIIEVSSMTGLRKTNYSETLYGDKKSPTSLVEKKHTRNSSGPNSFYLDGNDSPSQSLQRSGTTSKIPQSPVLQHRRLSMENLSPVSRSRSGSRDRSLVRDRSILGEQSSPIKRASPNARNAKNSSSKPPVPANSPTGASSGSFGKVAGNKVSSNINNTWNGRTPTPKGKTRPFVTIDTFISPNSNKNIGNKTSPPQFQRNSNLRSSTSGIRNMPDYDHNGRRIKTPPQTSPVKTVNKQRSQIMDEMLKTAKSAESDAMMIEKMKHILKQYSGVVRGCDKSKESTDDPDYSEFTKEWVRSNGTLERSQSSRQLRDSLNNRPVSGLNDAASTTSGDTSSGLKSAALVSKIPMFSPRRDSKAAGITSRIPAPVSVNSYKKTSDYFD